MKFLVAIGFLMISGLAQADGILVFETEAEFDRSRSPWGVDYLYDKKKPGPVEIMVNGWLPDICNGNNCWPQNDRVYISVPGLYFDRDEGKKGAIVFENSDWRVVCAYHRTFWAPKETEFCNIEIEALENSKKFSLKFYLMVE